MYIYSNNNAKYFVYFSGFHVVVLFSAVFSVFLTFSSTKFLHCIQQWLHLWQGCKIPVPSEVISSSCCITAQPHSALLCFPQASITCLLPWFTVWDCCPWLCQNNHVLTRAVQKISHELEYDLIWFFNTGGVRLWLTITGWWIKFI